MIFNKYYGHLASKNAGEVNLEDFIEAIKNPNPKLADLFRRIKYCAEIGDIDQKSKLKKKLPFFTPAVLFKPYQKRRLSNNPSFTNLLQLDYDGLPSKEYANAFKSELFEYHDHVICSWLSSSGLGVRALILIDTAQNRDDYHDIYRAVSASDYGAYKGYDDAPKNCVLPLFISHDPNILYREVSDCEVFDKRKKQEKRFVKEEDLFIDGSEKERLKRSITTLVNNITGSPGHTRLLRAAYLLGGHVGSKIGHGEAIELIESLIDQNAYLSEGQSAGKNYKKTAQQAICSGMQKPIR